MSLSTQALTSLQKCVSNNQVRAFTVPGTGSIIYETLPGYTFVVGVCYGGCVVDRIEHTASGLIWAINDDAADYCITESESDDWDISFAEEQGIEWLRAETWID
jgi:hypothetical protein